MTHIMRVDEMQSRNADEYRVYIINDTEKNFDKMSDENFIKISERNGTAWSLEEFENAWNHEKGIIPNPIYSYMRITDKFGRRVDLRKYSVYMVGDNFDGIDSNNTSAIVDDAKSNKRVWTLEKFVNDWNNNAYVILEPKKSYIKILHKDSLTDNTSSDVLVNGKTYPKQKLEKIASDMFFNEIVPNIEYNPSFQEVLDKFAGVLNAINGDGTFMID